jgi:capsular exopolysaccharide synthesis family protein
MPNASQKTYQNTQSNGHLIKQEISKYFRYWPFILGAVLIAITLVFLHLRYTKNQYKSQSKIKILDTSEGLELPTGGFNFGRSNINLDNNIEVLKSSKLWQQLVAELDLVASFYEDGNVLLTEVLYIPFKYELRIPIAEIKKNLSYKIEVRNEGLFIFENEALEAQVFPDYNTQIKVNDLPFSLSPSSLQSIKENIGKTYWIKLTPIKNMADRLRSNFNVLLVGKNSELLELIFVSEIEAKSERILNGIMRVFELDGILLRQIKSERTISFIQERFKVLASELDSIESGIADYKVTNNMLNLETKVTIEMQRFSETEQSLVNLEAKLLVLDFIKNNIKEPLEKLEILPNFIDEENSSINDQLIAYNALVFQMDRLNTQANSNNPRFQELIREMESLKKNLATTLKLLEEQLNVRKTELITKKNEYNATLLEIPDMEQYMRGVERQQQIKETLYLFLLQKREEAAINKAITESTMQVVEYASSQGVPVSPNPLKLYSIGVLLGLAVPIGFIYVVSFFDTKVKSVNDIKSIVEGLPILGEIPFVRDTDNLLLEKDDNSMISEAFRILSSNLSFVLPIKKEREGQVVLSTSTIKGEGKTFTSINLSIALSSLGKRVLLIGADLRNPQIHKALGILKSEAGLSTLLHNADTNWKDLIKRMPIYESLDVILSGPIPPNVPQLLNNGRLDDLLKVVKLEYDFIIIDSAPTLLVSDTTLIAPLADLTLFVTRFGYTDKELLNFPKEMNETGKIANMAFVFNGVKVTKMYGYGYKYGYNYGYNYGYGNTT